MNDRQMLTRLAAVVMFLLCMPLVLTLIDPLTKDEPYSFRLIMIQCLGWALWLFLLWRVVRFARADSRS